MKPLKPPSSTRRITRESGEFTRSTAGSRSLQRGLALLRCFLAGAPSLTNGQLAERTGLPRPTISRLTHALVSAGFLEYEQATEGYRLSPVHLAFGRAFQISRTEVELVLPLLRETARRQAVNIGLSIRDDLFMIYLETAREVRERMRQAVTAGIQLAMERASPGHAYLGALPPPAREALMARLAQKCGEQWPVYEAAIRNSMAMLAAEGYCHSTATPGLGGIACPLHGPDGTIYALNLSFAVDAPDHAALVSSFAPTLLSLAGEIRRTWAEFASSAAPGG